MSNNVLDVNEPQKVSYCCPLWVRDEQIRVNISLVSGRLSPSVVDQKDPVAVVCYGPSLNETWEQIRDFKYVITCSGAHKFLIERGIVPTYHCDVDPRKHKIALMGEPHHDVEYLLASACHPDYIRLLRDGGYKIKLWHVFDESDEGRRLLPPGEWALTGGCSVGLRALTIARFLGFHDLHVFGMDGSEGKSGKHASDHPMQPKSYAVTHYKGVEYRTTQAMLEAARQTFHELDELKDVTATFYGEGLVQAMAKDYVPKRGDASYIAFNKPVLISDDYRALNARLHQDNVAYGVSGGKYVKDVLAVAKRLNTTSILDYGCGKGFLAKDIPFPIWEYDPAVPGKQETPRPADLVVCTDVLEHIEPECLSFVLDDLRRCTKQVGYFIVHTGAAVKTLADGRNAHLIQQPAEWWERQISQYFKIGQVSKLNDQLVRFVVGIKKGGPQKLKAMATGGVTIDLSRMFWKHQPFAYARVTDVFDPALYRDLVDTFPAIAICKAFGGNNRKWSLSTVNNPDAYAKFLSEHRKWRDLHNAIKSEQFIKSVRDALLAQGITVLDRLDGLKSRWEFSLLPADGGCLRAHTDISSKLVTLVIGMRQETWDDAWGGGTSILVPKDAAVLDDYKAEFDEFDRVDLVSYGANSGMLFIKGDNSWHGVEPMTGPAGALRKTLTINIERRI